MVLSEHRASTTAKQHFSIARLVITRLRDDCAVTYSVDYSAHTFIRAVNFLTLM